MLYSSGAFVLDEYTALTASERGFTIDHGSCIGKPGLEVEDVKAILNRPRTEYIEYIWKGGYGLEVNRGVSVALCQRGH